MRYSSASPLSVLVSGWLSNIWRSSQRFRTSPGIAPASRRAWLLIPRRTAVVPAWLWTFTRNGRQPCSTSSGLTDPGATFTRISGLISTPTRQWQSRTRWIDVTADSSFVIVNAASSSRWWSRGSGAPRYSAAEINRVTCATNGCNGTSTTIGRRNSQPSRAPRSAHEVVIAASGRTSSEDASAAGITLVEWRKARRETRLFRPGRWAFVSLIFLLLHAGLRETASGTAQDSMRFARRQAENSVSLFLLIPVSSCVDAPLARGELVEPRAEARPSTGSGRAVRQFNTHRELEGEWPASGRPSEASA